MFPKFYTIKGWYFKDFRTHNLGAGQIQSKTINHYINRRGAKLIRDCSIHMIQSPGHLIGTSIKHESRANILKSPRHVHSSCITYLCTHGEKSLTIPTLIKLLDKLPWSTLKLIGPSFNNFLKMDSKKISTSVKIKWNLPFYFIPNF